MLTKRTVRICLCIMAVILLMSLLSVTAFAAVDVSTAIENTWKSAKGQVQAVVNNVVFPVVDMILAILFFVKLGTAYFDYRKHGQFEFTAPCILFACLIFTLTAPLYIWTILAVAAIWGCGSLLLFSMAERLWMIYLAGFLLGCAEQPAVVRGALVGEALVFSCPVGDAENASPFPHISAFF